MKIKFFVLSLLFFSIFQCAVSAHPGRTDASGGHYDSSAGEYHYHHGYPEHQHEDGICPYDFEDKTGYNSGNSGSGKSISTGSSSTTPISYQKEQGVSELEWIIIFALGLSSVLMYLNLNKAKKQIKSLKTDLDKVEKEKEIIEYLKQVYDTKRIEFWRQEKFEKYRKKEKYRDRRSELYAKYEGVPIRSILPISEKISFDTHGIPIVDEMSQEELWVYASKRGTRYHRIGCPSLPSGCSRMRVWDAQQKYKPCVRCLPCTVDFKWYNNYIKIKSELARYGYTISFEHDIIRLKNRKSLE